jgi:hypothetical protein
LPSDNINITTTTKFAENCLVCTLLNRINHCLPGTIIVFV